ncbi:MAG: hypothetical protein ACI9UK_000194 [Candidatus Krumholzibacteriia bacterium]
MLQLYRRGLTLFFLFSIATSLPAVAQRAPDSEPWQATPAPRFTTHPIAGDIVIDGELDDTGWAELEVAKNFAEHQPGDQVRPPVDTEVKITYNDEYLYVSYKCYDDPSKVRASFVERDRIWDDDYVILMLDTFGNQSWAYEIGVNPYGIQGDLLWAANSGEDMAYDLIYYSAGKITDEGWQVEMAIPWTSLRFPDQQDQQWRVDFWRNHPRDVRGQYSWSEYDRDETCWPCQWGNLDGITGVRPGSGLEILPSFVASQSGSHQEDGELENGDIKGEPGIGISYGISPTVTAEATINPDFSQVESDADQIDVNSTFALFFPEKRPFFQEGSDLWNTWFNVVYTRSINKPLWAAKATGRPGDTNFAVMVAQDEASPFIVPFEESSAVYEAGRSWSSMARYKRALGEESHAGVIFSDRRHEGGGSGTTFGADARWRLHPNLAIELQAVGSYTQEPNDPELTADLAGETFDDGKFTSTFDGEEFWGHGIYGSLERGGRHWELDFDYKEYSPTFRAESGFEPSNDRRVATLWNSYEVFAEQGLIDRVRFGVFTGRIWNFRSVKKDEWIGGNVNLRLNWAQTQIHYEHIQSNELFGGIQFDYIYSNQVNVNLHPGEFVNGGFNFSYGRRIARRDLVMGKETRYGGFLNLKPASWIIWQNDYDYVRSIDQVTNELLFSGYVARSRLNLQLSREWSARVIVQYNSFDQVWDVDPLLTWRLNPFTIFYVGSTRRYEDFSPATPIQDDNWHLSERSYFFKIQYLFQL